MGHTNFFHVTDEEKYQKLFSMLRGSTSDGPTAVRELSGHTDDNEHAFAWNGLLYAPVTEDVCRICPSRWACPFAGNKQIFSKTEAEQAGVRDKCEARMLEHAETDVLFWYDALQTILMNDEAAIFVDDEWVDIITRQVRQTLSLAETLNMIIRDEALRLLEKPDYRPRMGWDVTD